LKEIKVESPDSQLFFITGMDSLHTFMQWHNWQEILTLCHLVVNVRPNYQLNELSVAMQALVEECRYTEPSQTPQTSQTVETSHESLFMDKDNQKTLANSLDKTSGYILFSPASDYDISSTYIRAVLNRQQDKNNLLSSQKLSLLPTLLPKYVINYINQHHLYQK
jgi:nicotinate-nucleotide adenylyltransferase